MEKAPRRRQRVVPADERKDETKKSKKQLRREAFQLKLEQAAAAQKQRQEGGGVTAPAKLPEDDAMSVRGLEKSLPLFVMNWDDDEGGKIREDDPEAVEAKRRRDQRNKKKKRVPASKALDHWEKVSQHEAFQNSPLAALDEHLANCFAANLLK